MAENIYRKFDQNLHGENLEEYNNLSPRAKLVLAERIKSYNDGKPLGEPEYCSEDGSMIFKSDDGTAYIHMEFSG